MYATHLSSYFHNLSGWRKRKIRNWFLVMWFFFLLFCCCFKLILNNNVKWADGWKFNYYIDIFILWVSIRDSHTHCICWQLLVDNNTNCIAPAHYIKASIITKYSIFFSKYFNAISFSLSISSIHIICHPIDR